MQRRGHGLRSARPARPPVCGPGPASGLHWALQLRALRESPQPPALTPLCASPDRCVRSTTVQGGDGLEAGDRRDGSAIRSAMGSSGYRPSSGRLRNWRAFEQEAAPGPEGVLRTTRNPPSFPGSESTLTFPLPSAARWARRAAVRSVDPSSTNGRASPPRDLKSKVCS